MHPEGTPRGTAGGHEPARAKLVVFDLDGTITRQDTLLPYVLGFLQDRPWRLLGLLRTLPVIVDFCLGRADHGDLKASFIASTLGGATRQALTRWTRHFVPNLMTRGLHREALALIAEHHRAGDHLVLMSASPDLYVPAIADGLGFTDVICTELRWEGDRLNGALASPNRRGTEKTWVLRELRQRYPGLKTVAYANSASDLDHLKLADQGILVNGSAEAQRQARDAGITCVKWR